MSLDLYTLLNYAAQLLSKAMHKSGMMYAYFFIFMSFECAKLLIFPHIPK